MKLDSLQTLFIEQLRDLYNAETQLVKALPKMARAASHEELQNGFSEHLEQTKEHVSRLEQILEELDEKPTGVTCKAMKGLIEEGGEVIDADGDPSVLDAALIAAAQRVEHYEIAAYGSARTYADLLGNDNASKLLQQTLDEESETDQKLTQLATEVVNVEAAAAGGAED